MLTLGLCHYWNSTAYTGTLYEDVRLRSVILALWYYSTVALLQSDVTAQAFIEYNLPALTFFDILVYLYRCFLFYLLWYRLVFDVPEYVLPKISPCPRCV
jgi:hypothetical protein